MQLPFPGRSFFEVEIDRLPHSCEDVVDVCPKLLTITHRRRKGSQIFKHHCTWSHTCSVKLDDMFTVYAMEQPGVVAGNFDLSFSINFLNIFVHISGFIKPITLIWASLERPFPPAEVEYRWCQFWSKVMTSEVEERTRLVTAGYGRHKSQWLKQTTTTTATTTSPNKRFVWARDKLDSYFISVKLRDAINILIVTILVYFVVAVNILFFKCVWEKYDEVLLHYVYFAILSL